MNLLDVAITIVKVVIQLWNSREGIQGHFGVVNK